MAQPGVATRQRDKTEKNQDDPENDQPELIRPAAGDHQPYARRRCECASADICPHPDTNPTETTLRPCLQRGRPRRETAKWLVRVAYLARRWQLVHDASAEVRQSQGPSNGRYITSAVAPSATRAAAETAPIAGRRALRLWSGGRRWTHTPACN
jgi:hypothetical protein